MTSNKQERMASASNTLNLDIMNLVKSVICFVISKFVILKLNLIQIIQSPMDFSYTEGATKFSISLGNWKKQI